ncbi:hypothetical protein DFQ26_001367 [Actinomortierella ambigua]|nr:hypothetical protein DFQ26_001367 [Actinomortierella ambigua]
MNPNPTNNPSGAKAIPSIVDSDTSSSYSFRFEPRPTPSQDHRPRRYYFYNLDDLEKIKRTSLGYQKEGVPPSTLQPSTMAVAEADTQASPTTTTEQQEQTPPPPALRSTRNNRREIDPKLELMSRCQFLFD